MTRPEKTLTSLLGITLPAYIAVVGCGGKTSLVGQLAQENKHEKVLVSPTTKIFPMEQADIVYTNQQDFLNSTAQSGVCCAGQRDETTGKLGGFAPEILEEAKSRYPLLLMEADGSKGIDCKGWEEWEPVVSKFCTHTVGVVTVLPVGKPANKENVFRLQQFLPLTGLVENQTISLEALVDMVCGEAGMFKNSQGERSILVNKVETKQQERLAIKLLQQINSKQPKRFTHLLYGSFAQEQWKCL